MPLDPRTAAASERNAKEYGEDQFRKVQELEGRLEYEKNREGIDRSD